MLVEVEMNSSERYSGGKKSKLGVGLKDTCPVGFLCMCMCVSIHDMQGQGGGLECEPQDCLLEVSSIPRSS